MTYTVIFYAKNKVAAIKSYEELPNQAELNRIINYLAEHEIIVDELNIKGQ